MTQESGRKHWRIRYRPYIIAVVLAIIMTTLVMPEVMDGDLMSPTMEDGTIVVCTKISYSAKRGLPPINQVVVLEKKATKGVFEDNLMARVVGIPGDTIEIKENKVYRNGALIRQGQDDDHWGSLESITLGEDEVFLLGDNDQGKTDSRNEKIGTVSMKEIKGNVAWIIWPVSEFGKVN